MSLPVERDSIPAMLRDHLNRIRALEAKRPSSSGGGFGESVEVDQNIQIVVSGVPELLTFDLVYDPHSIFDGTDTFTIPAGLAGIWQLSHVWEITGE